MIQITVKRTTFSDLSTEGELSIDGYFEYSRVAGEPDSLKRHAMAKNVSRIGTGSTDIPSTHRRLVLCQFG